MKRKKRGRRRSGLFVNIKILEPLGRFDRVLDRFSGDLDKFPKFERYIHQKYGLKVPKDFFEPIGAEDEGVDKLAKKRSKTGI